MNKDQFFKMMTDLTNNIQGLKEIAENNRLLQVELIKLLIQKEILTPEDVGAVEKMAARKKKKRERKQ